MKNYYVYILANKKMEYYIPDLQMILKEEFMNIKPRYLEGYKQIQY
jgi:hypothetical protein